MNSQYLAEASISLISADPTTTWTRTTTTGTSYTTTKSYKIVSFSEFGMAFQSTRGNDLCGNGFGSQVVSGMTHGDRPLPGTDTDNEWQAE